MDLLFAFFAGMVWWEVGLFLVILGIGGVSLFYESSFWFFTTIGVILFIPWGSVSLYEALSFKQLLLMSLLYIPIGIAWSIFKWRELVKETIAYYESKITYTSSGYRYSKEDVKDTLSRKKSYDTIIFWILNWPFSVVGYFINDFIYKLVKSILERIYTVYDRITDSLLSKSTLQDTHKD